MLSGKYLDGASPRRCAVLRYLEMKGERQFDMAQRFAGPRALESTARMLDIAKEAGMSPVTLATAWSKQNDFVASTIVGVSREDQLDEILAAIDLKLSQRGDDGGA